ncbi:MAG: hypothetical protein ACYTFW_05170 [Planctomycetota bacterium]|jgi:hypothetical protein
MSNHNFTPNVQIIGFYPSNKVGLFIEDCTHFKKPKLRIAIVPVEGGQTVEFFPDLNTCRVVFNDLALIGRLQDDALTKTVKGKNGEIPAFDLFAKIGQNGHRSMTIINMDNGVYLKIINKNGDKIQQGVPLGAYNARMVGMAVSEYIRQLPLRNILAEATAARINNKQPNQDQKDGFIDDYQEEDTFPG